MQESSAKELGDLNVDRIDGVDDPASSRRWLIVKATDGTREELPMNVEALEQNALALVKALSALPEGEPLPLPPSTIEAINGLASALGLEASFKATDVPPAAPAAKMDEPPAASPPKPVAKAADEEPPVPPKPEDEMEALKSTVGGLVESMKSMKGSLDAFTQKSTAPPPPSTQPAGGEQRQKSTGKKMGDGLFSNFF